MWLHWLVFSHCGFCLSALWCPLSVPTVLVQFLWPWMWGISSRPLASGLSSAAQPPLTGCERWTIKKADCQRIDAFELCCWRRLLRVPLTARRSNQSILKEISPECSLEGLLLKLKLQYFGHLMWRTDSFEKTLMLGKIEGGRRRGWQDEMLGWHTDSMDMSLSELWELVMPSNLHVLCRPLLLLPPIHPSIRVFSN